MSGLNQVEQADERLVVAIDERDANGKVFCPLNRRHFFYLYRIDPLEWIQTRSATGYPVGIRGVAYVQAP